MTQPSSGQANGHFSLSGASRVYFIIGDPIAQVKSPAGLTAAMGERGLNAIVVPIHVNSADLGEFMATTSKLKNVDGIVATVPHKFDAYQYCATASARSHFVAAANVMRRGADGLWHGDMLDGLGFVAALRQGGCELAGRRALLVGAGGAGSAIAHALVEAGVGSIAVHDGDAARRGALIARLEGLGKAPVEAGSDDPASFDLVANATPMGMKPGDPLPVRVDRLSAGAFVGDVITMSYVSPLIAAARELGCRTTTGFDMFAQVRDLMVEFFMEDPA
jgi:shikimate dehydrogenase